MWEFSTGLPDDIGKVEQTSESSSYIILYKPRVFYGLKTPTKPPNV